MMLKKTLDSLLDSKEIKPVSPKGNQPRIFSGRSDAEAETAVIWQPDVKSRLLEKTLMLERLRVEGKGVTDDNMVGWPHRLNGHEFE